MYFSDYYVFPSIDAAATMLSTGKDEEDVHHDDRCVFQFSLKDLLTAGELQYSNKTIEQVAIGIASKI